MSFICLINFFFFKSQTKSDKLKFVKSWQKVSQVLLCEVWWATEASLIQKYRRRCWACNVLLIFCETALCLKTQFVLAPVICRFLYNFVYCCFTLCFLLLGQLYCFKHRTFSRLSTCYTTTPRWPLWSLTFHGSCSIICIRFWPFSSLGPVLKNFEIFETGLLSRSASTFRLPSAIFFSIRASAAIYWKHVDNNVRMGGIL